MFEQTDLSVMFEKKICDFPRSVLVYATALEGMLRILYMYDSLCTLSHCAIQLCLWHELDWDRHSWSIGPHILMDHAIVLGLPQI